MIDSLLDFLKDPVSLGLIGAAAVVLFGPSAWGSVNGLLGRLKKTNSTGKVITELLALRDSNPEIKEELNAAIVKLLGE